ncbi:DUF3307 domain-containing protein [Neobacillus sp. FSL H8-0543]|uniref:DUF3307 domain-containing protein n=1 Tax=Neobacillus sp. FSL H8-0543 TaxID=2954672 RepID=UPI003158DAA5
MLILCLILAHLIADFYLQTDNMVKAKLKNIKKHMVHHGLMNALVLTGFWMLSYQFEYIANHLLLPFLFIVFTHFVIDIGKIKLLDSIKINNEENLKRLSFFFLDQLLHLGAIILTGYLFFDFDLNRIVDLLHNHQEISIVHTILFIMIIIILATTVSGHIIRILLGTLPNQLLTFEGKYSFKNERNEAQMTNVVMGKTGLTEEYQYTLFTKHDLSRGKIIGYIERLLVLLLTFYSAYPAIGFIVAAKSIARFKQMDDRNWAEYFLLGTLTSMFMGITLGIVLREVLT